MDVPDDYDRDRRHETWREVHGWSKRARKRRADLRDKRRRNRDPGRFGKVNWDAYQHDQLFDMIMRANVGEMATRAGQWSSLAGKIEATTGDVQRVMERVMGAWHGQAAVSSAASNSRLMAWAGTASQTASRIADGMSSYTDAVGRAQSHMPDPAFATAERNFRDGYTVTSTGGPSTAVLLKQLLSDGLVSHEQARARKAEAVQVMEAYEAQSRDVHDTMPHFTDATPTTNQDVGPGPSPAPEPAPDPAPRPNPGPTAPPPGHPAPPPPASGVGGNSSTAAASFGNPALSGGPGGGPGGTGYGGGVGSLGSGGSDIVRNSPGYGGPGGLSGVGPTPGRGPAGAAGVANAARGAGGPGAFGGMPFGHGAQGEEDKEHRNKYDQGMDFLDDLPPAYPSVFGA
ncbi:PPE domain-containing protein [Actinophytocola glycyrrhizae]|uniref:PPE domain-containing protein n=1 Tax=Actinophytocola glycyrrhizae TaxID=2044873 RepID=A0ABV9SCU4_9PSEU